MTKEKIVLVWYDKYMYNFHATMHSIGSSNSGWNVVFNSTQVQSWVFFKPLHYEQQDVDLLKTVSNYIEYQRIFKLIEIC